MANLHNQFLKLEKSISLSRTKKDNLIASRKALEKRIIDYFRTKTNIPIPKFYIQGSYKMQTMVVKKDGSYDVDLGVYFLTKPTIQPLTLQQNVANAVKDQTVSGIEHKDKCIRVIYKGDFDIDLPVYYKTQNDKHPFLATKTQWQESDPKELCDWFEKTRAQKDQNGQMLRLIKYFKAWANQRSNKMPSGIAFTVWLAQNYQYDKRDDKAFFKTAQSIEKTFGGGFVDTVVLNPTTPHDNLLKLDFSQRTRFKEAFRQMLKDAENAITTNSNQKALNIWKQQFGDKFPTT